MSANTPEKTTLDAQRAAKTVKQTQGRSPAYPFIPLEKALERAMQLKEKEGFYAVPDESAIKAWGFGAKSSGGRQTIAALKHFGLLEYIPGAGDKRNVKLSDLARRIILDVRPDSPDKPTLIRQSALTPPIHAALLANYGDGLPSDTTIQTWLVLNKDFNETGAKDLIAEFRDTANFANLFQPADMPVPDHDAGRSPPAAAEVGDIVQVEIDGVLQLPKPVRVRAVKEHDSKKWVFVEGSETGIPIEQIVIQARVTQGSASSPPRMSEEKARNDLSDIRPDEREWMRGPLSRDTSYRLIVSGDLGPKEIGKLIKLLKAQQSVLDDDGDGDDPDHG